MCLNLLEPQGPVQACSRKALPYVTNRRGWDSSVGIAACYGLDGPGIESLPIPLAERVKARVCGRSLAGVEGSNPAGGMDVCVVCCK